MSQVGADFRESRSAQCFFISTKRITPQVREDVLLVSCATSVRAHITMNWRALEAGPVPHRIGLARQGRLKKHTVNLRPTCIDDSRWKQSWSHARSATGSAQSL